MSRSKLTSVPESAFKIVVLSDGTNTSAEIVQTAGITDFQVGWGVARRRKGDRRNPDLGVRLALSRAFKDAAERIDKIVKEMQGE